MSDDGSVTLTEFARRKGVSVEAVSKAVRVGRLAKSVTWSKGGRPRLFPDLADEEWVSSADPSQQRVPATPPPRPEPEPAAQEPKTATFQQARTLREAYMARLAKLEFDEKSGQLIRVDEVKNQAFRTARIVRDNMLNIPDRIAAELASETNPFRIHQKLTAEIRRALEELQIE